jgi:hypothetical protein
VPQFWTSAAHADLNQQFIVLPSGFLLVNVPVLNVHPWHPVVLTHILAQSHDEDADCVEPSSAPALFV